MKKEALINYIEHKDEKFTKKVVFKEGESTVFVLNFTPKQSLPSHKHPGSNVYLLVLEGEGTFTIDNNEIRAKKNDVILCTGDESLAFLNDGSENVSLYVMLNKIPNESYTQNI
ncbi:cupin domain-containing protein [Ferdinandcohnia quinoae]|uniref:Cupin domain-containing protein n=1 Tax=Fredinandcohnia quinoae TaxID=2918902 RepID=A0AAW5ECD7_9BACI|nr:cupin domain-containing protein [Fredinandcohnia sp. SECRCQ15]MCH1627562.1 cupin domain-containing protein [Fredinandcohnia sp. SECRCQ15]